MPQSSLLLITAASIRDLARAQRNRKSQIEVVVDIDIGLGRCGVQPGEAALRLAKSAVGQGLKCRGLMGYDGHLQVMPSSADRDEIVRRGSKSLVDSCSSHGKRWDSSLDCFDGRHWNPFRVWGISRHHGNPGRLLSTHGYDICRSRCFLSAAH